MLVKLFQLSQRYKWELSLLILLILVQIINSFLSPYYWGIQLIEATSTFLDKSFLVFPMALLIIMGLIDISVASTMALSAVLMAVVYHAGLPFPLALLLALLVGTVCGLGNGLLVAFFAELSPVIITICTMILYRGIAYIILEDQALGDYPSWFSVLGWGKFVGIPVMLWGFVVFAVFFAILLHKTNWGRFVYAIGKNETACVFSGVKVSNIKIVTYTLTGFIAGLSAIFLSSRLGSARPNIATGYELDIIAIVVLGGVSVSGGKGTVLGCVLSVLLVGYFRHGMGLRNVPTPIVVIFIGVLLLVGALISSKKTDWAFSKRKKQTNPLKQAV